MKRVLLSSAGPSRVPEKQQALFLVGDIWPILLKNMAALLIIGLFFFLITVHKTVKRLD